MKSLVDKYTQEELANIVKISISYKDLAKKLGYMSFSGNTKKFLERKFSNFDTSHFNKTTHLTSRTAENIFIKDSTADQSTLRKWYYENKYTPYICSICGQKPIWQEKPLTLILDHINGINNDDRLENLRWVCPNCNQQLGTTGSRNPNRKKIAKKYYCIDCGKEISKGSTRCVECYTKSKVAKSRQGLHQTSLSDMLVTREELKHLIRTTSFVKIGERYGVSDNAVRKWCDKLNLPRRKTEINSYSDSEWSKI